MAEVRKPMAMDKGMTRGWLRATRSWLLAGSFLLPAAPCVFVASASHALAQAAPTAQPPVNKMYTSKLQFRLPFTLLDSERQKLKEVQLYVKTGSENWVIKETVPPTQTSFSYRAVQVGEYWFGSVTIDKAGGASPSDLGKIEPALIVVVDSQAPDLNVYVPPASSGASGTFIRCEVRDANPDPSTLKLECQQADKSWRVLESVPGSPDVFPLPTDRSWTGVVRATATDRAGNTGSREVTLKAPEP